MSKSVLAAVILQYHHVSSDTPLSTSVTPEQFSDHMKYLKEAGFKVVGLPQLIDDLRQRRVIADKTVAITFDDGYIDVYHQARPILKQYDWPYTVFINPSFMDGKYSRHMSWQQLNQIGQEKATIANHTLAHQYLVRMPKGQDPLLWQQQITQDINEAEKKIADKTGQQHKMFAYPYGEFDFATQATVKALGFVAFGQHSGALNHHTDLTRIPRFPASGVYADLEKLKVKLHSLAFKIKKLAGANPVFTTNPPTLRVTLEVVDFKPSQLQCFNSGSGQALVKWSGKGQFSVSADSPLPKGRSRYNCTAPSVSQPGRFYWFSQMWLDP